ncbi:MAG: radical SAM protein [Candidatus Omnitrophica bacterium]|nr:radical SAM protein [Candidatus Omnitrophota bacterium]
MEKLKLDSHKLIYHIPRLCQWYKGNDVCPIYVEIGLYGGCNHRCIFCAFDFLKYKPDLLSLEIVKRFVIQAAEKGVKSILYSGEGEPLLHKNIDKIIKFTKNNNIDVALSTNGSMLDQEKAEKILPYLSWLRISLNAGTKKGYALIHGAKEDDFVTVLNNIEKAVEIRNKYKFKCTIGVQFLLIPQNFKEVFRLISALNDSGIDYLAVKPYSAHPSSKKRAVFVLTDKDLYGIEKKIDELSQKKIKIIFRHRSVIKIKKSKPYRRCLGLPFIAHISADGSVYPCNNFVGNKDFAFGNMCSQNFEEIWQGPKRKSIMQTIEGQWNVEKCRKSCRIDEINRYLWELRHPNKHVNFI